MGTPSVAAEDRLAGAKQGLVLVLDALMHRDGHRRSSVGGGEPHVVGRQGAVLQRPGEVGKVAVNQIAQLA